MARRHAAAASNLKAVAADAAAASVVAVVVVADDDDDDVSADAAEAADAAASARLQYSEATPDLCNTSASCGASLAARRSAMRAVHGACRAMLACPSPK